MNTRQHDLDYLEEAGADKKKIDALYKQSQNRELEDLRKLLIEAHKRRDLVMAGRLEEEIRKRRW